MGTIALVKMGFGTVERDLGVLKGMRRAEGGLEQERELECYKHCDSQSLLVFSS